MRRTIQLYNFMAHWKLAHQGGGPVYCTASDMHSGSKRGPVTPWAGQPPSPNVTRVDDTPGRIKLDDSDAGTLRWYVDAARGSDDADGVTPESAFRTLQKARVGVAEFRRISMLPSGGACVIIRAGEYEGPLYLTAEDGGDSPDAPVVWKAWEGEEPVVSGGVRVPAAALKVVPHPTLPGTAPKVLHVNLKEHLGLGRSDFGSLSGASESGFQGCHNRRKMEAHVGDTPLTLARYPNAFQNGTWRWMYVDMPVGWSKACENKSHGAPPCGASHQDFVWASVDKRVARWADEEDPWLQGYFQFGEWYNTYPIHAFSSGASCILMPCMR